MLKQRGIFFSTDAFFGLIIVFMGIAMITSFFVLPSGNDDLITMERLARDSARTQVNVDTISVFKTGSSANAKTQINVDHYTCFGELDLTGCSFTGSLCEQSKNSMPGLCQLNMEYDSNLENDDDNVKVHLP